MDPGLNNHGVTLSILVSDPTSQNLRFLTWNQGDSKKSEPCWHRWASTGHDVSREVPNLDLPFTPLSLSTSPIKCRSPDCSKHTWETRGTFFLCEHKRGSWALL